MSVRALAFSPDPEQRFMYVGDYGNSHVAVVERATLETVASFGERSAAPAAARRTARACATSGGAPGASPNRRLSRPGPAPPGCRTAADCPAPTRTA